MNEPPPLPETRWCSRCGASVQAAANFCHARGAAVGKSVATPQVLTDNTRKSRPKNRPVLAALLALGLIGLIVYAVLSGVHDKSRRQRAQQTNTPAPLTTEQVAERQKQDEEKQRRKEEQKRYEREESTLPASARFSGTQLAIKNGGTFLWRDTELEINGTFSVFGSGKGYRVKVGDVAPGTTLTIGLMRFANSDGERFNPFARKVQNVFIHAKTPHDITGIWYAELQ